VCASYKINTYCNARLVPGNPEQISCISKTQVLEWTIAKCKVIDLPSQVKCMIFYGSFGAISTNRMGITFKYRILARDLFSGTFIAIQRWKNRFNEGSVYVYPKQNT
jgi:hypothetical protein